MILKLPLTLAIVATLSILPASLRAEAANPAPPSQDASPSTAASQTEAMHMVPATAMLLDTIDAKKMQAGADVKAQLNGKVHLADGPELPSGTVLVGTVVDDDMNIQGSVKLALRFTQAQLKDGKTIPIKATIVGAYTDPQEAASAYNGYTSQPSNSWTDGILAIDQVGVASGVDLHSRITSNISGVFVATNKDDIRLRKGSDINLAIAAAPGARQSATTGAGS